MFMSTKHLQFDDDTVIFLVSRHRYFECMQVIIRGFNLQVEDCYFKVHRYFFQRDSDVFRGMFECPPGNAELEGRTKETAIFLPGVTKFEMTALLRFFTACTKATTRGH